MSAQKTYWLHHATARPMLAALCVRKEIIRSLIILLIAVVSHYAGANQHPGEMPDCWKTPRAVHNTQAIDEMILKHVFISKLVGAPLVELEYISPNHGYSFSYINRRPNSSIKINSEKAYLVTIALRNIFGLSNVKWVNENLIFFRVYIGQEVFLDIIFNVEREEIALSQIGRFSKYAITL
ncbi:hypothetical protein [uncultured Microbulbifer sp.]|uniref:hypothetical protein n=1 Tax=uncultured Microbulbifer sp. TaxID=348147 RepID=UPI00260A0D05|nr:hypothetical protein [uncultured Microbulbifer sp.]